MGTENAFAELGLAPDATDSEVKAAWRRLVSQWHPDRNDSSDAVARMQRINRAFEEIRRAGPRTPAATRTSSSTSATRNSSQQTRKAAPESPRASSAQARDGASATQDQQQQQHQESAATGTREAPRRPLHRKVKLTLEEAATGCIKSLRGKITDTCTTCEGAGHQVLGGNCAQCGGSGAVAKRSFFGWPSGFAECSACLGGGIARRPCPTCDGSGKLPSRSYEVKVRFPAGVRSGDLLHVEGGGTRANRPPADLEIRVEVAAHDFFTLHDDGTIHCEIPVDGFAWVANRVIQVPTVGGYQSLQLRRDQVTYRLKGQGFPVARRGVRADHLITVLPIFPDQLSADQEILLDQLLATTSGNGAQADARIRAWNRGLRAWERGLPEQR
ncbi:DnaJ C-terminal domain-containing protein [Variovorax brevis]|uniref:DnaJ C-terminal domain-containing protein n=1 Tax=Variovorax brevis TaxID=3053503 RepID=UPI002576E831|nr:DnaJ C-terminal domain-containing protein [Variovorax sp. J22R133]